MPKNAAHKAADDAKKEGNVVLNTFRKMMLASVGVVGVAQDEINHVLNRMVERGEITEKDARKLVSEMQREINKRRKSGQTKAEKEMESLMEKMNVPSKGDIEDLTKQVAHLSKRIEELKAEMQSK